MVAMMMDMFKKMQMESQQREDHLMSLLEDARAFQANSSVSSATSNGGGTWRPISVDRPMLMASATTCDFATWKEGWENFSICQHLESQSREVRVAALKTCLDSDIQRYIIQKTIPVAAAADASDIISALAQYIRAQRNPLLDRLDFYRARPDKGESFNNFYTRLKEMYSANLSTTVHGLNEPTMIKWIPDTGSDIEAIDVTTFKELGGSDKMLAKDNEMVFGVNGERLDSAGKCTITISDGDSKLATTAHVYRDIKGAYLSKESLILMSYLPKHWPNSKFLKLSGVSDLKKIIISDFSTVFDTTTLKPMKGPPMVIHEEKNAMPHQERQARRIAPRDEEQIKAQLNDMVHEKILEPVSEPSEWCHPIVIVDKKNSNEKRMTVQEILNDCQIKLRKAIAGHGPTSETVTEIVSKDRLTKAHPWELSRLQTPFTWTIAKATKQTPARSGPAIPSADPAPQFNIIPSVTSTALESDPDPAPNPVNDPEQQPIHPPTDDAGPGDDDNSRMPLVNPEPEPRLAPKRKASILNDSLSPTKPEHKKMVLDSDFASTMAEATFHVATL
ncbi:hypothetical protein TCAL_13606, partial [Tigriopus californicus]|eukprot:TCALIF_13606-PA protein Name:"Protein of unknown function" AED:0.25 eAED:0.28 QI:29/0/0/0.66/0/0.33/3/0/560